MSKRDCSNCRYTHTYNLNLCNPEECVTHGYRMWSWGAGNDPFEDDLYVSGGQPTGSLVFDEGEITLEDSCYGGPLQNIPASLLFSNGQKLNPWIEMLKEYDEVEEPENKTHLSRTCLTCLHSDRVHDYSGEYLDIFNICSLQQHHIVKLTSLDPCMLWEENVVPSK